MIGWLPGNAVQEARSSAAMILIYFSQNILVIRRVNTSRTSPIHILNLLITVPADVLTPFKMAGEVSQKDTNFKDINSLITHNFVIGALSTGSHTPINDRTFAGLPEVQVWPIEGSWNRAIELFTTFGNVYIWSLIWMWQNVTILGCDPGAAISIGPVLAMFQNILACLLEGGITRPWWIMNSIIVWIWVQLFMTS